MNIIDSFFLDLQNSTGINTQRGIQNISKQYPLIVYHQLDDDQNLLAYDRKGELGSIQNKNYNTVLYYQVSILSSFLDKLTERLLPQYKSFLSDHLSFSNSEGHLAVFPISKLQLIPFSIEGQKTIYQYTQDIRFTTRINITKEVGLLDLEGSIKELKINIKEV